MIDGINGMYGIARRPIHLGGSSFISLFEFTVGGGKWVILLY